MFIKKFIITFLLLTSFISIKTMADKHYIDEQEVLKILKYNLDKNYFIAFRETLKEEIENIDSQTLDVLLLRAFKANKIWAIKILLKFGANPDLINPATGYPLLMDALSDGDLSRAKLLLDCKASPDTPEEAFGNTSLMAATADGFIDAINLLAEYNADVNVQNYQGATAPMIAIARSAADPATAILNREMFSALSNFESRIDVELLDCHDLSLLDFAERNNTEDFLMG